MRALRSSPSLTAADSSTSGVDHARRHTTGEAAHPSSHGSWQQTSCQYCPNADQAATEPTIEPPSSLTSTPELGSASSVVQSQSSAPAGSPTQEKQPVVAHSGLGGTSTAEADLLSFVAQEASWQHSCDGFAGQQTQEANGLINSDSSQNNTLTGLSSLKAETKASIQVQDSLRSSGNDSVSLHQSFVSPCLLLPEEFSADDPFQHSAALAADVSQSSRRLSGLSMLADSQGSDLDSWGSFRLPDEESNLMAEDMADRQAGLAQSSHPMVAGNKKGQGSSGLSITAIPVADSQSVKCAAASPNACITSKQRLQLDLFLQSSGGGSTSTAG